MIVLITGDGRDRAIRHRNEIGMTPVLMKIARRQLDSGHELGRSTPTDTWKGARVNGAGRGERSDQPAEDPAV
jgi:hypothetical protein